MGKHGYGSTLITIKPADIEREIFPTTPVVYKEREVQQPYVSPIKTVDAFTIDFEPTIIREQEKPILQNIFIKDNIPKSIEREFRQSLNALKGVK